MRASVARIAATCAFGVALRASPLPAQTSTDPAVEAEHGRGLALRAQHRDVEARAVFERLYAQTHEPRALARLALAEGATGDWALAEEHLLTALRGDGDAWIRANRGALESNLERVRAHLASVLVESRTPGATLWMKGALVGELPLVRVLRVTAGAVTFEVRAPGYFTETRREVILSGETLHRVAIDLRAAPRGESSVTRRAWRRPVAATLLALGAMGLAIGGVATSVGSYDQDRFDAMRCRAANRGARPECDALEDEAVGVFRPMQIAGFVAGGLLAVAGGVVSLVAPSADSRARARWACAPGANGVVCAFAF